MTARKRVSRQDFGDEDSIGLQVKRIGKTIMTSVLGEDYGSYLGEVYDGRWIIGIWGPGGPGDISQLTFEEFNSLEELKRVWELD